MATLEELWESLERRSGQGGQATAPVDAQGGGFWSDVGNSLMSGVGSGITGLLDMPSSGAHLAARGVGFIGDQLGYDGQQVADNFLSIHPFAAESASPSRDLVNTLTGDYLDYQPQTTAGEYAQTIGEFAPAGLSMSPGGLTRGALQYTLAPAIASEAAGQLTEGSSVEPYARIAGALAAPLAIDAVGRSLIPRIGEVDPIRAGHADLLMSEGIDVSAGQRAGNEMLRRLEGGTRGGEELASRQMEQFTSRILREVGEDATRATPEVLERASSRIGGVFDDVARGVDVLPDPQQAQRALDVVAEYGALNAGTNQAPIITNVAEAIADAATNGALIPADQLMRWRSLLSRASAGNDPATRQSAGQIIDILDDALEGTLTSLGRAEDVARIAEARGQWRNLLAVQDAATRAGEGTAAGLITPDTMRSSLTRQGRGAMATGRRGDIADLSIAGAGVLGGLRNSGTPAGIRAQAIPLMAGAGAGSSIANALTDGSQIATAIGAMAGATAPYARNALLMSRPVQRALMNQDPALAGFWPMLSSPIANALLAGDN